MVLLDFPASVGDHPETAAEVVGISDPAAAHSRLPLGSAIRRKGLADHLASVDQCATGRMDRNPNPSDALDSIAPESWGLQREIGPHDKHQLHSQVQRVDPCQARACVCHHHDDGGDDDGGCHGVWVGVHVD